MLSILANMTNPSIIIVIIYNYYILHVASLHFQRTCVILAKVSH